MANEEVAMRDLPPGYTMKPAPYTGYAEYFDENGKRVLWYTKDADAVREVVWREYFDHIKPSDVSILETKGEAAERMRPGNK